MKIFIISFFMLSFGAFAQRMSIDRVAAQIGENIILQSDVEAQKLQAMSSGFDLTEETDCQILEDLMFQNLLLNQAEIDSIVVSDAQVDAEMENRIRVIEQQIGVIWRSDFCLLVIVFFRIVFIIYFAVFK